MRKTTAAIVLCCAFTVVVAARGAAKDSGEEIVSGDAAAHYGAWSLYRNLALFFGKRAMMAEIRYREAVTR